MSPPGRRESGLSGQPPLREAKRELTRRRLVAAATAAFESKHYADVTVDDISDRAGISRATFYLYYSSKAKILLDCLDEFNDGLSELWDQFAGIEKPTVPALEGWLISYIDLYAKHKPLLAAVHEAEAFEPEFRDNVVETVKDTVSRWRQLGVISADAEPGDDIELRVLLFSAQIQRFLYLWIIHGIEVNREKAIRKLAEQWYDIFASAGSFADR
jgi:AcrR family transcriptional regulator